MRPVKRTIRGLCGALLLSTMITSLPGCGTGDTQLSGGGTGGTGISTGSVTGFGSVVMNGTHFLTDNAVSPGFRTKKISNGMDRSASGDRDVFHVGMVVSIRHASTDNNAVEIDYEPNLVGPIESMDSDSGLVLRVLGQPVVLDNAALFASLAQGSVIEASGFVDSSGRIRATYLAALHPAPMPGETFEIRGYISGIHPSDGTFEIGPLPGGSGTTTTVSYTPGAVRDLPSGPADGMYVRVETRDTQPGSGEIRADHVMPFVPRTDFPEGAPVDLEGLVTRVGDSSGGVLSFELEGKAVRTDGSTTFLGGTGTDIERDRKIQVRGTESGGVLSAIDMIFR